MIFGDAQWVLLDTDVWSLLYAKSRRRGQDERSDRWRTQLQGRSVAIATQTRAEVLTGLAIQDVGESRRNRIVQQLDSTTTVPVTEEVLVAYADLAADCKHSGHALWQKQHTGDRWVAATSIAVGAPLLAGDGIYKGAPRLVLFTSE